MNSVHSASPIHPRTPFVSIVLPVYNGSRYLHSSIRSVMAQTMRDWEFIIWNDGSSDTSSAIMNDYASDPRVRLYSHSSNKGLFETLNAAISVSRGQLIRLWSQDDIMKPECLEAEADFNENHPDIAMSYCQYDVIDSDGALIGPAKEDRTPEIIPPQMASQIMFYHGSLTGNIANVTLRRRTLQQLGLFRTDMRVAGDFEMWVRIAQAHTIGFLRRPLLYLRSHTGQFSRRAGSNILFMRETRAIHEELMRRFPHGAQEHARRYYQWHHLRLHVHDMLRCLFLGKASVARQAFREISKTSSTWRILLLLAVTLDGRIFRPTPRYFDGEFGVERR